MQSGPEPWPPVCVPSESSSLRDSESASPFPSPSASSSPGASSRHQGCDPFHKPPPMCRFGSIKTSPLVPVVRLRLRACVSGFHICRFPGEYDRSIRAFGGTGAAGFTFFLLNYIPPILFDDCTGRADFLAHSALLACSADFVTHIQVLQLECKVQQREKEISEIILRPTVVSTGTERIGKTAQVVPDMPMVKPVMTPSGHPGPIQHPQICV